MSHDLLVQMAYWAEDKLFDYLQASPREEAPSSALTAWPRGFLNGIYRFNSKKYFSFREFILNLLGRGSAWRSLLKYSVF